MHLGSAEEWIVSFHVDVTRLVGNELEADAVRIEDLAAARDESASGGLIFSHGVAQPDERAIRVSFSKLPRHTTGFAVKRDCEPPHYAATAWVRKRLVLANYLHGQASNGGDRFHIVV